MPKRANQKTKLLYLMRILLQQTDEEHGLTLDDIVRALAECGIDAERKALYNDFEMLRTYGIDIEMRRGKTVRYHVVSRDFELPELKLLVDAVQSSKFITRKKSEQLIGKIERLASHHEAKSLHRQVYVANRLKTVNETIYYTVDHIHEAMQANRQLSFRYYDYNVQKNKVFRHDGNPITVSPWALIRDDENYYMVAYDAAAQKIKHYRVDKMQDASTVDEPREGGEQFTNFDTAAYAKKTFGMFGGDEETVTLECQNDIAGNILDRFGMDIPFTDITDTHFRVRVKAQISPPFFTWLMNFRGKVKILAPTRVQQEFLTLAQDIVAQYTDS